MKRYVTIALGAALLAQSAGAMAATKLANITLLKAAPNLFTAKLPVFGGTTVLDLPLVGGYLSSIGQVGLNQYFATVTHGASFLTGSSQNFLPILTGAHGEPLNLKSTLSALKSAGARGSGGIRREPLAPQD